MPNMDLVVFFFVKYTLLFVTLPALAFAFFGGGKWVFRANLLLCGGAAAWLVWLYNASDWSGSGIELLPAFVATLFLFCAAVWSLLCYALAFLLRLLPKQRKG